MNMPPDITPESVHKIITEREIPLRRRAFAAESVNEIFRYGAGIGAIIEQYEHIGRGMEQARRNIVKAKDAGRSFPSGSVILSAEMGHSRGRFKRYWHAPRGGIWMTLVLVNTLLPESSLFIPMAAGVACCEALRDYNIAARIKWVNDVLADGRKICGILTETFSDSDIGEEYVLVGIGINVNNTEFPAELSGQATSMQACLDREVNLPEITALLLAKLRWNIGLLHHAEAACLEIRGGIGRQSDMPPDNAGPGEHPLLQCYRSLTDIGNRRVLFGFNVQENPQFEGTVLGLDATGGLILELDDGSRMVHHSGEIIYLD